MKARGIKQGLVPLAVAAALVAAACGGSSSDSKSTASSSGATTLPGASAPIAEAKKALTASEAPVNKLEPAGAAFDAKSATNAKTVGWVTVTNSIPFTTAMLSAAKEAAKTLGLQLDICDGKGQPAEWARCYQRFIGQKVDVILSQSIDPRIIKSSIAAANKAGIPVVTSSSNYPDAALWPGTAAEDAQPFKEVGTSIGDYLAADSDGKANALFITSNEVYTAPGQVNASTAELQKYCPQTCKWKVVNVPIADWGTRIPTVVQSEITKNPKLTYVIPNYDGAAPFAIQGVHAANAQSRVKVVSFNALPDIMKFMQRGDTLTADVGVWVEQHGYAAIDDIARVLAGRKNDPALTNPKLAMRMFDTNNVKSLNFDSPATWYGSVDLAKFYGDQWQVGAAS
jgi:ribose transport system substrate-binding protein